MTSERSVVIVRGLFRVCLLVPAAVIVVPLFGDGFLLVQPTFAIIVRLNGGLLVGLTPTVAAIVIVLLDHGGFLHVGVVVVVFVDNRGILNDRIASGGIATPIGSVLDVFVCHVGIA